MISFTPDEVNRSEYHLPNEEVKNDVATLNVKLNFEVELDKSPWPLRTLVCSRSEQWHSKVSKRSIMTSVIGSVKHTPTSCNTYSLVAFEHHRLNGNGRIIELDAAIFIDAISLIDWKSALRASCIVPESIRRQSYNTADCHVCVTSRCLQHSDDYFQPWWYLVVGDCMIISLHIHALQLGLINSS